MEKINQLQEQVILDANLLKQVNSEEEYDFLEKEFQVGVSGLLANLFPFFFFNHRYTTITRRCK